MSFLKLTFFIVAIHFKIEFVDCSYCNTTNSILTSYGQPCVSHSSCVTNYCSNTLCLCRSGTYFDTCSQTCQVNCNYTLIDSPSGGIISSIGYPYGTSNLVCTWTVQASSSSKYVSFTFTDVHIPYCDINIYSSNTKLGTVCSLSTISAYVTDTTVLKIQFTHRSYSYYRGFRGYYNIYDYNAVITSSSGVIASHGYPLYGRPYQTPSWLITGGQMGYTITLSFTINGYYYLNVSTSTNTRYVLVSTSTNVTLDSNSVRITIWSSINYPSAKFYATYAIYGKQYGSSCTSTNQCNSGFVCFGGTCRCETNQFYNQTSATCHQRLQCRSDKVGTYRCLCPTNTYYYLGYCYYDSDLTATVSSDSILSTYFMYLKLVSPVRTLVSFNVSWAAVSYSNDKGYNHTTSRDVFVGSLTPNRSYRFSVTTILPSDSYYLSKTRDTVTNLETRRLFDSYCSNTSQCDERLNCVSGRCGCVSQQYYNSVTNTCHNRLNKGAECIRTEECRVSLTCVQGFCGCQAGQYYHTNQSCYYVQTYGAWCNRSIDGMCRSPDYVCTLDNQGMYRCLCPNNTFSNGNTCTDKLVNSVLVTGDQLDLIFYTFTGLKNFTITWTAEDNVLDKGWQQIYGNTVKLSGLTPGQEYLLYVSTSLTADSVHESHKYVLSQFTVVTLPASPGHLWREKSRLSKRPYFLKFNQSRGVVHSYQITIKNDNSKHSPMVRRVVCPEIITSDLTPNTEYLYEITAYNKLGNASLSVAGRFKTLNDDDDDDDDATSAKQVDDNEPPPGWMIAVACIGWVSTLTLVVAMTFVCLRNRKKNSSPDRAVVHRSSIDRSDTYCNMTNTTSQTVRPNDYRNFPQHAQVTTPKRINTSQYVNTNIHQIPGSSHVNLTFEPELGTDSNDNSTYEEIGNMQADREIYINLANRN